MTRNDPPAPGDGRPAGNDEGDAGSDDDEVDEPLDETEAASGAAVAREGTGESLGARVGRVIADLEGVTRTGDAGGDRLSVGGRVFAVVGPGLLEVALDERVARAALATPDTRRSARGAGWIAFAPADPDRFALDRAEAWLRSAHRRATDRA